MNDWQASQTSHYFMQRHPFFDIPVGLSHIICIRYSITLFLYSTINHLRTHDSQLIYGGVLEYLYMLWSLPIVVVRSLTRISCLVRIRQYARSPWRGAWVPSSLESFTSFLLFYNRRLSSSPLCLQSILIHISYSLLVIVSTIREKKNKLRYTFFFLTFIYAMHLIGPLSA